MSNYYVYAYLRSIDSDIAQAGTPYYIGKGTGKRAWKHCKNDVIHPPIDVTKIIILETNLTDIGALALERRMIAWYGRKDIGTGILHNTTDGGEGTAGFKHSVTTIEKMSKPKSKEHAAKNRIAFKDRTHTIESRESMVKTRQNRTDEKRAEVFNNLSTIRTGIATVFDLELKKVVKVNKEEFTKLKNIKYVGLNSKLAGIRNG